jgi:hypothetical protein
MMPMNSNHPIRVANEPAPAFPPHRFRGSGRWIPFAVLLALSSAPAARGQSDDADKLLTMQLSEILQAARSVVSRNQDLINDASKGDKGLTGAVVLREAMDQYRKSHPDPLAASADSNAGRLLRAEMDAIVEVMDQNQATINAPGTGFKGFIPAVFGRLVSEAFNRRAAGDATMKVTAPPELVRNRRARPDAWEESIIRDKFRSPAWQKGAPYFGIVQADGHAAFGMLQPEYYAASCLSCHGSPKDSLDVTGYPREGAKENDLGGVISIRLKR